MTIAAMLAFAATAHAQSTRYPPPVVDADEEREGYSDFWENAIEPGRETYDALVDRATARLAARQTKAAERAEALEWLVEATAILPERADAWGWLGLAREKDADWQRCREALDRTWAIDPKWHPESWWSGASASLGVAVGVCRGRAGDLEGAMEVLEQLVARGDDAVETLWRLGEVYMALGRLDDARAVLEVALDQSPADRHYTAAAWAMAVAADRALDTEVSREAAATALRQDPERVRVQWPESGFLPPADAAYYAMLAAVTAGVDEEALFFARRFLALDPESPWKDRTLHHVKLASTWVLGDDVKLTGKDPGDPVAAKAAFAAIDADVQECLKQAERTVLKVSVTVVGDPVAGVNLPKSGAHVTAVMIDDEAQASSGAIECVRKLADTLSLARPAVAGTWTTATVLVIRR